MKPLIYPIPNFDPIRVSGAQRAPDNRNVPPHTVLREFPILAAHWFGVDLKGGAS